MACASVVGLAASEGHAQTPTSGQFALDRFEPTPIGDNFYSVEGGQVHGHLTLRAGVIFDYAHNPLLLGLQSCTGTTCTTTSTHEGAIVKNQLFAHVGVSFALWEHLLLSLSLPIAIVDSGDSPHDPVGATPYPSPSGAAVGDLRVGARVNLYSADSGVFDIGVGGYLWVPTGKEASYTSDGKVRGMPELVLGGRASAFVWAANGGVEFRKPVTFVNTHLGDEFTFGAAAGIIFADDHLQIGPELFGSTTISNGATAFKGPNTDLELLGSLKVRAGAFVFGGGVGPGLASGVGAPSVRALLSLAYSPEDSDGDGIVDSQDACPHEKGPRTNDPATNGCPDRDNDGIIDARDACPDLPGIASEDPKKNGCPDRDRDGIIDPEDACPDLPGLPSADPKKNGCPDRDHDGIIDPQDACPDVPGVANADPKKNGCPPDRDGDGIPDAEDACPDVPGVPSADPKKNGCPSDRDGDGIPDAEDACPDEKGPRDPDPKKNGCPRLVRFSKRGIQILQQVQFDTGKATIKRESDELLGEVVGAIKDHPEIKKIRVEGHTDNVGAAGLNLKLSDARAGSVMKWLIAHGIESTKLVSEGFGKNRPIADNKTKEGRAINRRVDFVIIDPPPPPDAGK